MKLLNNMGLLLLIFFISACNPPDKDTDAEFLAMSYAKAVRPEIPNQYLSCYALGPIAKKQCIDKLTEKYVERKWQDNQKYILTFQFEAEKIGFRNFVQNLNLHCENIVEGPEFENMSKAYVVKCSPKQEYLMRYNYTTKEWHLVR